MGLALSLQQGPKVGEGAEGALWQACLGGIFLGPRLQSCQGPSPDTCSQAAWASGGARL